MRLRQVLLVALLAVAGLAQAQMPQLPPIPVDKAVRVGKLSTTD
jgi:zinc protease